MDYHVFQMSSPFFGFSGQITHFIWHAHDQSKYPLPVKESHVCGSLTEKQAKTSPVGLLTSDLNLAGVILIWQTSQGNSLLRGMEEAQLKNTMCRLLLDDSRMFQIQIQPSDFDICFKPSALSLQPSFLQPLFLQPSVLQP